MQHFRTAIRPKLVTLDESLEKTTRARARFTFLFAHEQDEIYAKERRDWRHFEMEPDQRKQAEPAVWMDEMKVKAKVRISQQLPTTAKRTRVALIHREPAMDEEANGTAVRQSGRYRENAPKDNSRVAEETVAFVVCNDDWRSPQTKS